MKKILTGTLALLLIAGAAQAQKQDTATGRGNDRIKKELNLTADQQTKLKSIKEQERKEKKALRDKYQDQRQSVFSADQKKKLETLKSERKENAKGKKPGKHKKNFKKTSDLQAKLNLSQEQKDQMQKMRAESKGRFDALRKNEALNEEQKKEQMMSLKKEQREKMKSILTKEQIEKMESAKKNHKARNTK